MFKIGDLVVYDTDIVPDYACNVGLVIDKHHEFRVMVLWLIKMQIKIYDEHMSGLNRID